MRAARLGFCLIVLLGLSSTAFGQAPIASADITRLETTAADIDRDLVTLRTADPTLAASIEKTLVELREEITYLKVKLRMESGVQRAEYSSLRDRLETLRVKAQGKKVGADPVEPDPAGRVYVVPVGTELEVRLQDPLNSGTAKVEQRFETTLIADYLMREEVVIPAGSLVRGFVSSVRPAGHIDRRGSLTLSFDEIRIGTRTTRLRATVVQTLEAKSRDDNTRIGAGAVVGGVVGAILGGAKGALIGVMVGGGGTIAATEGADVDLPAGTILRIRLDQALELTVLR